MYGCVRLGAHLGAARLSKSSLGLSTREQTFRGSEKGGLRTLALFQFPDTHDLSLVRR